VQAAEAAGVSEAQRRKRILEGARAIFFREGVGAVTMEQVAARLGISKKTLYKHFSNRDQLIEEAIEEKIREVGGMVDAVVKDGSQTFPWRLGRIFSVVGQQFAEIGELLMRDVYYRQPSLWDKIERFRREHVFHAILKLFEDGARGGYVRTDIDSRLVPTLFVNAASAILTPAQMFALPAPPAVVFETFIKILLGGILTAEGRAQFEMAKPPDGGPRAARRVAPRAASRPAPRREVDS